MIIMIIMIIRIIVIIVIIMIIMVIVIFYRVFVQNNLRWLIICCLFSGGMQNFPVLFVFSFDLPIEVILSAILFPIKSPAVSAVF